MSASGVLEPEAETASPFEDISGIDGLDVLDEIRLRTWARTNYVPADEREVSWHPIILDEMTRRDEEMIPAK